jgi:hypothetical protein
MQIQLPPGKYFFRSSDEHVVEVRLEEGQELYLQMQLVVVHKGGFKGGRSGGVESGARGKVDDPCSLEPIPSFASECILSESKDPYFYLTAGDT